MAACQTLVGGFHTLSTRRGSRRHVAVCIHCMMRCVSQCHTAPLQMAALRPSSTLATRLKTYCTGSQGLYDSGGDTLCCNFVYMLGFQLVVFLMVLLIRMTQLPFAWSGSDCGGSCCRVNNAIEDGGVADMMAIGDYVCARCLRIVLSQISAHLLYRVTNQSITCQLNAAHQAVGGLFMPQYMKQLGGVSIRCHDTCSALNWHWLRLIME